MSDVHHQQCPQAKRAEHRHSKWRKTDAHYNTIIYCSVCGARCLCRELHAADAVERVRDLHLMRESLVYADGVCRECSVQFPCPTIAALDGGQ